ncbi:hypothetical protein BC567DRAFT_231918 [Phyllosticta citribraziliensis]
MMMVFCTAVSRSEARSQTGVGLVEEAVAPFFQHAAVHADPVLPRVRDVRSIVQVGVKQAPPLLSRELRNRDLTLQSRLLYSRPPAQVRARAKPPPSLTDPTHDNIRRRHRHRKQHQRMLIIRHESCHEPSPRDLTSHEPSEPPVTSRPTEPTV